MSVETCRLRVESLDLKLGKFALQGIDLECAKSGYHILLGPTGSGKSTLLKCLLGLHKIDRGRITLGGREITHALPEHRRMGYVPQNYALFPHMTVERNIRFGIEANRRDDLEASRWGNKEADGFLERLLSLFKIRHLRDRGVHNLSGGEKQRVAIARALAARPELILLDEPFSAIDTGHRRRLWHEVRDVLSEIGVTALHITHNLEEAHVLGERVSVMIDGRLVQTGTPQEILERPATEAVGEFLGYGNIFHGKAETVEGGTRIRVGPFDVIVGETLPEGSETAVCIRPQDIKILKEGVPLRESLQRNCFEGILTRLFLAPESCTAWFALKNSGNDCDFELRFPRYLVIRHGLEPGKQVRVAFWEPAIIIWTRECMR